MKALALAGEFEDLDYQQRATYGLWLFTLRRAEFRDFLAFSHRYGEIATRLNNRAAHVMANMMTRESQTILGAHLKTLLPCQVQRPRTDTQ